MGEFLIAEADHYIVSVLTCICFLIFILYNRLNSKLSLVYFISATSCILIVVVSEFFDHYLEQMFTERSPWRFLTSATGYAFRPAIAFFISLIPLRDRSKNSRYSFYVAIPAVLNALLSYLSMFVKIIFTIEENNTYAGGPLHFLPFVVSAIYLVFILVFSAMRARKADHQELNVCICIALMCLVATIMEAKFDLHGLLPSACIAGEIFYYMFFLINKYTRDPLTNAYVRSKFYKDAEKNGARYFIMFDINGLKRINDNKGHIAGDNALVAFANAAIKCLSKNAQLYRLGGDEFAIIYYTTREEDVKKLVENLRTECKELPYGFSCGYAMFNGGNDFSTAYTNADIMLYQDKDAFWQSYRKRGSK